jgi:hypothetical protein
MAIADHDDGRIKNKTATDCKARLERWNSARLAADLVERNARRNSENFKGRAQSYPSREDRSLTLR